MKKTTTLIFLLFLATGTTAFASGSSAPAQGGFANAEQDPLLVTETMKCTVVKITDDGKIAIRDEGKEDAHWLAFGEKTRFLAANKKAFGGKKKLQAADLEVGHVLKVTLRPATGEITKVRVLKES